MSYWNAINFISLILNVFVVLADLGEMSRYYVVPFLAVAVLFMWIKLLYFGRMFFSTAWMVRMVSSVAKDMRFFLIIFTISVISFANAYEIISRNGTPPISGGSFFYAIVYSYKAGLGDFDLSNFEENSAKVLVYIMWVLNTFLIMVVFLNLLIAIISDIFDKVHENIKNNLVKELVFFMVESEVLINRRKLFKKHKYMIIVTRVRGETGEMDADSKLSVIRNNMDLQVRVQNKEVENIQKNLETELKERIFQRTDAIETSSLKALNSLGDRIDETEVLHNKYKVLFETLLRAEA